MAARVAAVPSVRHQRPREVVGGGPSMSDHAVYTDVPAASAMPGHPRCRRLCRAALFIGVGATAGVVAFYGIGIFGESFRLPEEIIVLMSKERLTEEEFAALTEARVTASYQNTALSVAILGGVAGGLFGLAAGLPRGMFVATAGLFGGTLLGSLFGGMAGTVELFTAYQIWPIGVDSSYKAMATHSIAYLIVGVAIGIVAGLAVRRVRASLGVVLAAAVIAGLVYPGVAAHLFPIENTDAVVPPAALLGDPGFSPFRFAPLALWTLLPTALMGLALGRIKALPEARS
jgi:hypothetical protein